MTSIPALSLQSSIRYFFTKELPKHIKVIAPVLENDSPANATHPSFYVSVSGGCDSVALLHLLHETKVIPIQGVVHMDHQQRGEATSQYEQNFVKNLCERMGYPCYIYTWNDGNTVASPPNGTVFSQNTARAWRRKCYQQLPANSTPHHVFNHPWIVTAHHQDDSYESILLKLLRGTHISHIRGIQPLQTIDNVTFVRPLLSVSKASLMEYLQSPNFTWVEDASNASPKYVRNRIRNELVPLLRNIAGGSDALHRRLDSLVEQSQLVHKDSSTRVPFVLKESVQPDNSFHVGGDFELDLVGQEALYQWINSCLGEHTLTFLQLERIVDQLKGFPAKRRWSLDVSHGYTITRDGDILRVTNPRTGGNENVASVETVEWCLVKDDVVAGQKGLLIKVSSLSSDSLNFVKTIVGDETLRVFRPPWRENPLKIKDFLRGQKVPLHRRSLAPVILNGRSIVAVYVETSTKWVCSFDFDVDSENENELLILLRV